MVIPEDSCRTGKRAKVEGVERPKSVHGHTRGLMQDRKKAKVEGVERPKSVHGHTRGLMQNRKKSKGRGSRKT